MARSIVLAHFIVCQLLLHSVAAAERPAVVLQTHLQPPYQVLESSQLSGSIPLTLECIFNTLNQPYVITIAPRKRNRALVKSNRIDGFFLSVPDKELDTHSIATEPLALERWKFYRLKGSHLPEIPVSHPVGSVLGSNEEIWLKENGFPTTSAIPNTSSLVKLLTSGRIPYVLADEKTFESAAKQSGISLASTSSHFMRYVPLVTYFSNAYVSKNPKIILRFNTSLNHCIKDIREANENEKAYLASLSRSLAQQIDDRMIAKIEKGKKNALHLSKRKTADEKWKEAVLKGQRTDLIDRVLADDISQDLKQIAGQSPSITEIFLSDDDGYILGMNKPTSDYWQGDEAPFEALFKQQNNIHISDILFDHSTRKFQIQVSLPLIDKVTATKRGLLTIGYDAEKVFSSAGL